MRWWLSPSPCMWGRSRVRHAHGQRCRPAAAVHQQRHLRLDLNRGQPKQAAKAAVRYLGVIHANCEGGPLPLAGALWDRGVRCNMHQQAEGTHAHRHPQSKAHAHADTCVHHTRTLYHAQTRTHTHTHRAGRTQISPATIQPQRLKS